MAKSKSGAGSDQDAINILQEQGKRLLMVCRKDGDRFLVKEDEAINLLSSFSEFRGQVATVGKRIKDVVQKFLNENAPKVNSAYWFSMRGEFRLVIVSEKKSYDFSLDDPITGLEEHIHEVVPAGFSVEVLNIPDQGEDALATFVDGSLLSDAER